MTKGKAYLEKGDHFDISSAGKKKTKPALIQRTREGGDEVPIMREKRGQAQAHGGGKKVLLNSNIEKGSRTAADSEEKERDPVGAGNLSGKGKGLRAEERQGGGSAKG